MKEFTLLVLIGVLSFLIPCAVRETGFVLVDRQLSEGRALMEEQNRMFLAMAAERAEEAK